MQWPVEGDVVLPYSSEKMIKDPTLDQYRTNDSISIGTVENAPVFASADGTVTKIGKSIEDGNYVVIDHGNGYSTTYSQLTDELSVVNGSIVKKGDVIGRVAKPTRKSSSLGFHLTFKVTKDGVAIDPMQFY